MDFDNCKTRITIITSSTLSLATVNRVVTTITVGTLLVATEKRIVTVIAFRMLSVVVAKAITAIAYRTLSVAGKVYCCILSYTKKN